jgi:hypothetical protein
MVPREVGGEERGRWIPARYKGEFFELILTVLAPEVCDFRRIGPSERRQRLLPVSWLAPNVIRCFKYTYKQ